MWLAVALLVGCADPQIRATPVPGGIEVVSERPVTEVAVTRADGALVAVQRPPSPATHVTVLTPATGDLVVTVDGRRLPVTVPDPRPYRLLLQAPAGQVTREVVDGERVPVVVPADGAVEGVLMVEAREPVSVTVQVGQVARHLDLSVAGARAVIPVPLSAGDVPIRVDGPVDVSVDVDVRPVDPEVLAARLRVVDVAFPALPDGRVDTTRPADRVDVPAPWWSQGLVRLGLGVRPRDDQAPWANEAVTLDNTADEDVVVAVSGTVLDGGRPDPAFRSRIREASTPEGEVSVLVRVPATDTAVAVLPVFVDRATVRSGVRTRRITVTPLGGRPLHVQERPIVVRRGSTAISAGFVGAVVASLVGLAWLAASGRRWIARSSTTELVTIALFGSLTFVVAAASNLLGYGVASILGPFAPFLTGIVDDAFRVALLAALVTLIPRVGVFALATLTGYLLRGLALGSFHPVDLLYLGNVVLWHEALLWVAGITRNGRWRDVAPAGRILRLGVGFGVANALSTASGLVTTMVLYRLFLAEWYVAAIVGLPGFVYVLLGCAVAVPFAASLRQVTS